MRPPERERRIFLRGIGLPLSIAEAVIRDARQQGDEVADALERALRDGRFARSRFGRAPGGSRENRQPLN